MPGPDHDAVAILALGIESLIGRPADPAEMRRFRKYLVLLMTWNRTHRLTGCRSADAIVRQLFLDSLLFLSRLPAGPLTVVDLGTGAGIPGVPIRLVRPEIALTLVESRRKQVSFLAALKRELDLADVAVLEGRAEELVAQQPDLADAFDVVVTRAVGMRLQPTAMLFLKPGGLFVVGGPPALTESPADRILGARWETVSFRQLRLSRAFFLVRKPP